MLVHVLLCVGQGTSPCSAPFVELQSKKGRTTAVLDFTNPSPKQPFMRHTQKSPGDPPGLLQSEDVSTVCLIGGADRIRCTVLAICR
jgi:hypothetical protein